MAKLKTAAESDKKICEIAALHQKPLIASSKFELHCEMLNLNTANHILLI
jgi:hypothetical protein